MPVAFSWSQQHGERRVLGTREPKSMFQATARCSIACIDFVILQWADQHAVFTIAREMSERDGVMGVLRMHTQQSCRRPLVEHRFECPLQVGARGDRKSSRCGDDRLKWPLAEVRPQRT